MPLWMTHATTAERVLVALLDAKLLWLASQRHRLASLRTEVTGRARARSAYRLAANTQGRK